MVANADITIYNHFYNCLTDEDQYFMTQIKNICWQEKTAIQVAGKGVDSSDYVLVMISMYPDTEKNFLPFLEWKKVNGSEKSKHFTFKEDDIVAKGLLNVNLTEGTTYTELQQNYEHVYRIKSIQTCDYGEEHWELILQ